MRKKVEIKRIDSEILSLEWAEKMADEGYYIECEDGKPARIIKED